MPQSGQKLPSCVRLLRLHPKRQPNSLHQPGFVHQPKHGQFFIQPSGLCALAFLPIAGVTRFHQIISRQKGQSLRQLLRPQVQLEQCFRAFLPQVYIRIKRPLPVFLGKFFDFAHLPSAELLSRQRQHLKLTVIILMKIYFTHHPIPFRLLLFSLLQTLN